MTVTIGNPFVTSTSASSNVRYAPTIDIIRLGMEYYIPNCSEQLNKNKVWFTKDCQIFEKLKSKTFKQSTKIVSISTRNAFVCVRKNCNANREEVKTLYDQKTRYKLMNTLTSSETVWSLAKAVEKTFTSSSLKFLLILFPTPFIWERNSFDFQEKSKPFC